MEIPEEHRIKDKTVQAVIKTIQSIFNFAVKKGYLDVSPASNMQLNLDTSYTFAAYTDVEVRRFLEVLKLEKI